MRKGIVLSYNKVAGIGLIVDANQQRIKFYYNGTDRLPFRGELVFFEIKILNGSLAAEIVSLKKLENENTDDLYKKLHTKQYDVYV